MEQGCLSNMEISHTVRRTTRHNLCLKIVQKCPENCPGLNPSWFASSNNQKTAGFCFGDLELFLRTIFLVFWFVFVFVCFCFKFCLNYTFYLFCVRPWGRSVST